MSLFRSPVNDHDDEFLARRYLVALTLVALLIVFDQAVIQPGLYELTTDAPVITVAGRQRTLSQRLCKVVLELDRASTEAEREPLLQELTSTLELWVEGHDGLRDGKVALGLPPTTNPTIQKALADTDPYYLAMSREATKLANDNAPLEEVHQALKVVLANEGDYLSRMERILELYQDEARDRVDRLRRTGWLVTVAILVALIGIGLFILRPAALLIRQQFAELREARDVLEVRVAERTRDLEQANRDLQRESEERTRAEARQRELLDQLGHVSRITTVGEMATGLAHELNQPLGAVANYVEGCLVLLEAPAPRVLEVREALNKALAATLRAGEIIKRIRRFVNRRPTEHEPFSPNKVAAEVEALLRREAILQGITIELELENNLPDVVGDAVQIQQILVNLVRNATESVAAARPLRPWLCIKTGLDDEGDVKFEVEDNGEGIAPAQVERVFEPFFSTRAEGMGMGLAISRTLVEAHGGRLTVSSEPGTKTVFRFTLPANPSI